MLCPEKPIVLIGNITIYLKERVQRVIADYGKDVYHQQRQQPLIWLIMIRSAVLSDEDMIYTSITKPL